jgi:prolyl oligopeptidase
MQARARTSAALALALAGTAAALPAQRLAYPAASTVEQVDDYHGTRVADPYRWLEDADAPETRAWIEAENALTERYLAGIPARAWIRRRMGELRDFTRWTPPVRRGARYFFLGNGGAQPRWIVYVASSLSAEPGVLLDPATLTPDGRGMALSTVSPSPDGRLLAYAVSPDGGDWTELRVRDVATRRDLPDRLRRVRFANVAWTADGGGFFYARYPAPAQPPANAAENRQRVFYHRAGTPQEQDVLVYDRPDEPNLLYTLEATEDGRYLVISGSRGSDRRTRVAIVDLRRPAHPDVHGPATELLPRYDAQYVFAGNRGPRFYFRTDHGAPRGRVIAVDLNDPGPARWRTVVAEDRDAIQDVKRVGGRFVVARTHDVATRIVVYGENGRERGEVRLPGPGAASALTGRAGDRELFYSFASFLAPPTIYRYDLDTGRSQAVWPVRTSFDAARYVTEQLFVPREDGTRVPVFVTRRRDLALDGRAPLLLYGYGGFGLTAVPQYSTAVLVWLEMGGVYASAGIRGGAEYGEAWHRAGMREHKQTVFDDFVATAEFLVERGYTSPRRLAIQGESNGGLLVGAVMTQRPDLFGAGVLTGAVLDMLRFDRFTVGWAWVPEYGSPRAAEEFRWLHAYSPLHHVRPGTRYPAMLLTASDHDDRVAPGHSFKFTAAVQAAQAGPAPILIRVETSGAHAAGKPITVQLDEAADRLAFLVGALGFEPRR